MSAPPPIPSADPEKIVENVRERYGRLASSGGSCCPTAAGCGTTTAAAVTLGYDPVELVLLPEGADLGLGCGAPLHHLRPGPGEVVLDLGSGAGIDALLAARAVGPAGRVIGVDMTPEMLARARANAAAAGLDNVEFREGRLEALPVADASVDAVTSNCVINLVPDKGVVFREVVRVLRPGGRLVVSDIVLDGALPPEVASDVLAWVGCVAGAMQRDSYLALVASAGLGEIEILRDVDYLAAVGGALPPDLEQSMVASGVHVRALEGLVRSLTYRACKP